MSGRKVGSHSFSGDAVAGRNEIDFKKGNLIPGIYFYEIITLESTTKTGKMIIR